MLIVCGLTICGLFGPVMYFVTAAATYKDEYPNNFKPHKNQQDEEV
jgi:predicted small lipoprotein YifL